MTSLRWLNPESSAGGVSWGVPWPRGALAPGDPVELIDRGASLPLQTRTAAFWPDGSVKWTAHAAVFSEGAPAPRLQKGTSAWDRTDPPHGVTVTPNSNGWAVDTGVAIWVVPSSGDRLFGAAMAGGRVLLNQVTGVCLHEGRSPSEATSEFESTVTVGEHRAVVTSARLETQGPLQVVVRQEGHHRSPDGRTWLPFILRSTFYAGQASVGLVHTLIYDGDPQVDFIKGLGLRFSVPQTGDGWNRHSVFAGETGVIREAAQGLMLRQDKLHPEVYRAQHGGHAVDIDAVGDPRYRELVEDLAVWNDYRLSQATSDSFTLRKRTGAGCCWVDSWSGRRARGVAFAGTAGLGGVSVGMRHFWQKAPSALEIGALAAPESLVTAWLWSPDAPAMDLRHYDTQTHMDSSYEGFHELRATPVGVANTSELRVDLFAAFPSDDDLMAVARALESPPLLVCPPETYLEARVFGQWAAVDRSTPARAAVEDQLASFFSFYQNEIDQRRWYGFWNYGDVMHTYDPVRHTWRYDVGGYAWQNTELVPNLWLWLSFLRTGREDVFRMAEAMTRHTSETDVYHLGEYQGLGSRHNVVHWGCGCKEARISMAGLHRVFYYLTGDGRTGEIMDEVKDSDFATAVLDPMRDYFPKDGFASHVRSGPDWAAFVSNWMTRWERLGDEKYRDQLLAGIESLKTMPFRLASGPTFGYNPGKGGKLHYLSDENYSYHMVVAFGAPEVWFELAELLDDEVFKDMLAEFGEFYTLDAEALKARTGGRLEKKDWDWPLFAVRMMAYAGHRLGRPDLSRRAWQILFTDAPLLHLGTGAQPRRVTSSDVPRPVDEIPWVSTNIVSQWCLNAIECLALVPEALEEMNP